MFILKTKDVFSSGRAEEKKWKIVSEQECFDKKEKEKNEINYIYNENIIEQIFMSTTNECHVAKRKNERVHKGESYPQAACLIVWLSEFQ